MSAASPQDLPLDRLEAWLRGHIEEFRGPVPAERVSGGQPNPTFQPRAGSGADRALEPEIPRLRDRGYRGDGPPDRLAAAAPADRGAAGDRPWRLPHGQSGLPQNRAARHRRPRLGIVDDRRSDRRFRLSLPDL